MPLYKVFFFCGYWHLAQLNWERCWTGLEKPLKTSTSPLKHSIWVTRLRPYVGPEGSAFFKSASRDNKNSLVWPLGVMGRHRKRRTGEEKNGKIKKVEKEKWGPSQRTVWEWVNEEVPFYKGTLLVFLCPSLSGFKFF